MTPDKRKVFLHHEAELLQALQQVSHQCLTTLLAFRDNNTDDHFVSADPLLLSLLFTYWKKAIGHDLLNYLLLFPTCHGRQPVSHKKANLLLSLN